MPLSLIFLLPYTRREISLGHTCSQITLYFPLTSCWYSSSFPVSELRTALILYSGLVVGSAAHFISLLTRCCSFGGKHTGVDTKLLKSRFQKV